jgi:hypothetical protein
MKRTRSSSRTRTSPRIIPAGGGMQSRPRPFAGRPQDTQVLPRIDSSDITQVLPRVNPSALPSVYQHTDPVPSTALAGTLPLPVGYLSAPPSARHTDPVAWHDRTHVEDEWPDVAVTHSRARHALEAVKAEEGDTVLAAVQQRAHAVLDAYDPMRRAEAAARANDDRMRSFAAKWDAWETRFERDVESWCARFKKELASTRDAWAVTSGRTNADRLAMDYADGGTSAALYTKDQLAREIARRDHAGSAVSR